ncbi:MAG: GGDEF domain-containing protein, partial [Lysobacteraceae bacterium]
MAQHDISLRMTDWLVGGPADPGPELQAMMWRYHFRAVNVLLTGVLGCLALDLLVAVRLGLPWYLLPAAVHTAAGLYHVQVSIRIRHAIDRKRGLPLTSFVVASLIWTSLSGFAAAVAFSSSDVPLQIVVSLYMVGLASAIPGRHAAMPRIALVEIATILVPSFLIGAFAVGSLWFAMPILCAVFLFVGDGILTHVYELELAVRRGELAGRTEARSDPLTGLGNRRGLEDLFDRAESVSSVASVLYLDLDGFKQVNDRLGHEAGDELLVAVADRLRATTVATDAVHRVGGDEFVVVTGRDGRDAVELGLSIVAALTTSLTLVTAGSESVRVGVSVGMATYDPSSEQGAVAMRRADRALYQAKARGKG